MSDFWTTFISSVIGSGVTAFLVMKGLSGHVADRWLARYKNELDKEFESYRDTLEHKRKKLEADLSRRIYISQTQFDTEFNAIKAIFDALGKLRLSFNGMRPTFEWGSTDEKARLEALNVRLYRFKEVYNTLVSTAESLYPFVPEDLYQHISECMSAAQIEVMRIETAGPDTFGLKWYEDGAKQLEKFNIGYFGAAKLARERIQSFSIIS